MVRPDASVHVAADPGVAIAADPAARLDSDPTICLDHDPSADPAIDIDAVDDAIVALAQESRDLQLERLQLLVRIREEVDPAGLGYSHRVDFAREELHLGATAFRGAVRLGRALARLPRAREALRRGWACESRLLVVLPELTEENESVWVRRAIRRPVVELHALVREARRQRKERKDQERTTTVPGADERRQRSTTAPGAGEKRERSTTAPDADEKRERSTTAPDAGEKRERSTTVDVVEESSAASERVQVSFPAPAGTRQRLDGFAEEVARRTAGKASRAREIEVALAEFSARHRDPEGSRVEVRREWPPRFLDGAEGSSPREAILTLDERRYVHVPAGVVQEEVAAPRIPSNQTDGRTFVTEPPPRFPWKRTRDFFDMPIVTSMYRAWQLEVAWKYEEDRAAALQDRVARRLAAFDAWEVGLAAVNATTGSGSELRAVGDCGRVLARRLSQVVVIDVESGRQCRDAVTERGSAPGCDRNAVTEPARTAHDSLAVGSCNAASDDRELILRYRAIVTRLRTIRLEIADCLHLLVSSGFLPPDCDSLEDYVGDRLDISIRTAYDWMAQVTMPAARFGAPKWNLAEQTVHLGDEAMRQLMRLANVGAAPWCLDLWIERAAESTVKALALQVDWVLAHWQLAPLYGFRIGQSPLEPPSWEEWSWIHAQLRRRPDLLADRSFHRALGEERAAKLRLEMAAERANSAKAAERANSAKAAEKANSAKAAERANSAKAAERMEARSVAASGSMMAALAGSWGWVDVAMASRGAMAGLQFSVAPDAEPVPGSPLQIPVAPDAEPAPESPLQISVAPDVQPAPGSPLQIPVAPDAEPAPGSPLQISVAQHAEPDTPREPWSQPPDFQIPPPDAHTTTRILITMEADLLDDLRRAFARIRGRYGESKPAWWCLEVLLLQARHGWIEEDRDFRRRTASIEILERDGFTCSTPVCTSRRDLTVHHITFRSAGGSDDPENLVTLCAACHLHGIHDRGTIRVSRDSTGRLVWTIGNARYAGDGRVLSPR